MYYAAAGESVMVTDAVGRDANGNPTAASAPRQVDGVMFQSQTTTTDTSEHGQIPVTTTSVLFPESDPIALGAVVTSTLRGRFHVVGTPQLAQSQLTGRCFGLIVHLVQAGSS